MDKTLVMFGHTSFSSLPYFVLSPFLYYYSGRLCNYGGYGIISGPIKIVNISLSSRMVGSEIVSLSATIFKLLTLIVPSVDHLNIFVLGVFTRR